MPPDKLTLLLSQVRDSFDIVEGAEITLEGSPETLTGPRARELLENSYALGVNRVSFGIQTFDNDILKRENRGHNRKDAFHAAENVLNAGIANLNVDLIPGLQGHTEEIWQDDVSSAHSLGVHSITAYPCTVHPTRTPKPFMEYLQHPEAYPDIFEFARMYTCAQTYLENEGFSENPPWWFTKPGGTYRQQLDKWGENAALLGIGADAYSWVNGWQFWNQDRIKPYIEDLEKNKLPIHAGAHLSTNRELATRHLLFGIRTGIDLEGFQSRYSVSPDDLVPGVFEKLTGLGLVEKSNGTVSLTRMGKMFSDEIIYSLTRKVHGQRDN